MAVTSTNAEEQQQQSTGFGAFSSFLTSLLPSARADEPEEEDKSEEAGGDDSAEAEETEAGGDDEEEEEEEPEDVRGCKHSTHIHSILELELISSSFTCCCFECRSTLRFAKVSLPRCNSHAAGPSACGITSQ
jgi:hypothetical protein